MAEERDPMTTVPGDRNVYDMFTLFVAGWFVQSCLVYLCKDYPDHKPHPASPPLYKRTSCWVFLVLIILFPITVSITSLPGREWFVWAKVWSLVLMSGLVSYFKWIDFHNHKWRTITVHACLALNICEALVKEGAELHADVYNTLNVLVGMFLLPSHIYFARKYGCTLTENPQRGLEQCSNLSFWWVTTYTFWNLLYNAMYHPTRAAYYWWITLIIPYYMALVGGFDWVEARVWTLLGAVYIRLAISPHYRFLEHAPLENWSPFFESSVTRWILVVAGLLSSVMMFYDMWAVQSKSCPHHKVGKLMCPVLESGPKQPGWTAKSPQEASPVDMTDL